MFASFFITYCPDWGAKGLSSGLRDGLKSATRFDRLLCARIGGRDGRSRRARDESVASFNQLVACSLRTTTCGHRLDVLMRMVVGRDLDGNQRRRCRCAGG
jgi:hypothetical protein